MNGQFPPALVNGEAGTIDAYDARARQTSRFAAIAAAALLATALGGAVLVPIGGAVIAPARVAPESRIKRIAHPTGGVIAQLRVADGDAVEAGDVLVQLDTSVSQIDAELSQRSLVQLLAQRARLTAEVEDRPIRFPAELLARRHEAARAAIQSEQRRYALNRAERAGLAAQLDQRTNQLSRQIEGYESQIAALQQEKVLIEPELAGLRKLKEQGYVTIRRLNEMERTAVALDGSIGAMEANVAQSRAAIAETRQQRIQIGQAARAEAGAELAQVETAINAQRVASADAGDRLDRASIRAPYAGIVDKLAFVAVGEVVRPAETIMEIVPRDDQPVFEGAVAPGDIDRVRTGQTARVRLSAFNSATTPEVTGRVIFVSADPATDDASGSRFYRVRVALDARSQPVAKRLGLVSGMPAELFVETGSRSMLSYVTKPLRDQFARAFRN